MSEEYGVSHKSTDSTGWFVAIIVALVLLTVGLVFSANRTEELTPDQVRCMIAHPGVECEQITRWEPAS